MNKTLLLLALLSLCGLLLAPAGATATAVHAGAVAGIVVDAHGNPVAGAAVVLDLRTVSGTPFTARTHTDLQGHFGFRPVPPGRGVVSATEPTVGSGRARVAVRSGQVTRVRIVLQ